MMLDLLILKNETWWKSTIPAFFLSLISSFPTFLVGEIELEIKGFWYMLLGYMIIIWIVSFYLYQYTFFSRALPPVFLGIYNLPLIVVSLLFAFKILSLFYFLIILFFHIFIFYVFYKKNSYIDYDIKKSVRKVMAQIYDSKKPVSDIDFSIIEKKNRKKQDNTLAMKILGWAPAWFFLFAVPIVFVNITSDFMSTSGLIFVSISIASLFMVFLVAYLLPLVPKDYEFYKEIVAELKNNDYKFP